MHQLSSLAASVFVSLLFILATPPQVLAQTSARGWTWLGGNRPVSLLPVHGVKGVPAASNTPGNREFSVTWQDADGNLWLFGGYAYELDDPTDTELYCDLWKYNRTARLWSWEGGRHDGLRLPVYGTEGEESDAAAPGSRTGCAAWVGSDGKLYMFGGTGYASTGSFGSMNELWSFNPTSNRWAFLGGDQSLTQPGNYGDLGVPHADNWPGARSASACWKDSSGTVWLFGGSGLGTSTETGYLNDLWKYESGLWTWMGGSTSIDVEAVTGTQGTSDPSNWPGSLSSMLCVQDGSGNVWLHGGYGYMPKADSGFEIGSSNDLWRLGTDGQWTWMSGDNTVDLSTVYGEQGTPSVSNVIGGRTEGIGWFDTAGNLWRYGGSGQIEDSFISYLEETWVYDTVGGTWTWMRGEISNDSPPAYGAPGEFHADNNPGLRMSSVIWENTGTGRAWIYSGSVEHINGYSFESSDLWELNTETNEWAWMWGPKTAAEPGIYNTKGVAHPDNRPGMRYGAITWFTPDNEMWLFGGFGCDKNAEKLGHLNDLWKYDRATGQWTWISGSDTIDDYGRYISMTNPHSLAMPPARLDAAGWVDSDGNLWLHGGESTRNAVSGIDHIARPDLWKFDRTTKLWTWMKGGQYNVDDGVYGEKGVGADANLPGSRHRAVTWTDHNGNFWLFGGYGASTQNRVKGRLNDLWMYTPANNQWTWIHGENTNNPTGSYSAPGVFASGNTPGGRENACGWVDAAGDLWLFGGYGYTTRFQASNNELWKFDVVARQWALMSGKNDGEEIGQMGELGVPAEGNRPGSREKAQSWLGADGKLWLYGGEGRVQPSSFGMPISDLWSFDTETNLWTWEGGGTDYQEQPVFGVKGQLHPDNTPGALYDAATWVDETGVLWMFGGVSLLTISNDRLWKFGTGEVVTSARDWQLYQ